MRRVHRFTNHPDDRYHAGFLPYRSAQRGIVGDRVDWIVARRLESTVVQVDEHVLAVVHNRLMEG